MRGPRDEVPGGDPRIHVAPFGTLPAAGVGGRDKPGHDEYMLVSCLTNR
jgi:hypothetical protein